MSELIIVEKKVLPGARQEPGMDRGRQRRRSLVPDERGELSFSSRHLQPG